MKKTKTLRAAISTLRPGDVITNLACASCAHGKILVLERDTGGSTFELSMAGEGITFIRDTNGPFHWNGSKKAFYDKHGRQHDHISLDCAVLEAAGLDAVEHYKSLPVLDDVNYAISPEDLTGGMFDGVKQQKLQLLLRSLAEAKDPDEYVGYMQLIIQMMFGDTKLNEQQMRGIMIAVNGIAQARGDSQPRPSLGGLEDLIDALMGGLVGVKITSVGGSPFGEHDETRLGNGSRERAHQH